MMRTVIAFLVVVLLCRSDALAWSVAGHRLVATIAFRQLSVADREKVVAVLRGHPRYEQEFDERMPANIAAGSPATRNEWLFQQAALWPDMARDYHGELQKRFHRPNWHFINKPIFLTGADKAAMDGRLTVNLDLNPPVTPAPSMNVIQSIRLARKILSSSTASASDKGLMLSWLFHNVGDIHQPLHSSALFSRHLFENGDRGGNLVLTEQVGNLHSLWDRFPGGDVSYSSARNRAIVLLNDANLRSAGGSAASSLDESEWLDESHKLAIEVVYHPDLLAHLRVFEMSGDGGEVLPMDLGEDYLREGRRIADRRVVEAGFRLAAILKAMP